MTESTRPTATGDVKEMSTGDLVVQLSRQPSGLVRQEMRLAQAELRHKARNAGVGAGLGGAGTVGRRRARRGAQPIPEQAVASVRQDAQTVKERSRHA